VSEVTSYEIDQLLSVLRVQYSARTVNNVRTALSKVFSDARRHGLVLTNPVAQTQKARRGEFEPTQVCPPWSVEETLRVMQAVEGTSFEAFLTLAMATGMRRGELLGLKWSDIDFGSETVSIERTIHRETISQRDFTLVSRVVEAPPKTASSRRVNQLTVPVIDVLRRHQMEQDLAREAAGACWEGHGYVFTNRRGGPLDGSNFYKRWRRFMESAGLGPIRIHDIRHTFATILVDQDSGLLPAVSKALGHSSLSITMGIYANTARVDTHATSRMSEILFPDRGKVLPISVPAPGKVGSVAPGFRRST